MNKSATVLLCAATLILAAATFAQQPATTQNSQQHDQGSMPGMDMGDMQQGAGQDSVVARSANDAMSGGDMDMNPHMFMTDLVPKAPGDDRRAAQILDTLRASIGKYKDYKAALADGYKIFLPNIPQKQYHFTNYRNALTAQFQFDPAHPTSLLYRKTRDGYELAGAMYTAPRKATEEQLNERVPLSVARWHKHVNFCLPPRGTPVQEVNWKKFGLEGSIVTQDSCAQAGGRWIPQVFGWMVHVYPFESDPGKIWAH